MAFAAASLFPMYAAHVYKTADYYFHWRFILLVIGEARQEASGDFVIFHAMGRALSELRYASMPALLAACRTPSYDNTPCSTFSYDEWCCRNRLNFFFANDFLLKTIMPILVDN